jgi:hypothetical protein
MPYEKTTFITGLTGVVIKKVSIEIKRGELVILTNLVLLPNTQSE